MHSWETGSHLIENTYTVNMNPPIVRIRYHGSGAGSNSTLFTMRYSDIRYADIFFLASGFILGIGVSFFTSQIIISENKITFIKK